VKTIVSQFYENDELLGNDESGEGWGFLSWRAAVPLFVTWRRLKPNENQTELIEAIDDMCKVPDVELSRSGNIAKKLLSPRAMIEFYLYVEEVQKQNPSETLLFTEGEAPISYQAVMNQLEQGIYMPKGETDEVLEHLNGITERGTRTYYSIEPSIKRSGWDHEHFRLAPSE